MDRFLNVLICPHQRRKHVQAELERLTPGVIYMGQLDMSELPLYQMEWAERREGVFVRWPRSILDTSMPRILSGRLNCAILLAYVCDETTWGYALYYKGSPVDNFRAVPGYLQDGGRPGWPNIFQPAKRISRRISFPGRSRIWREAAHQPIPPIPTPGETAGNWRTF